MTEYQKNKLEELDIEFKRRASLIDDKPYKHGFLDGGYSGEYTKLWDWFKEESQRIIKPGQET